MISQRQRTKLTRWLRKWQRRLCLSDWTITCQFADQEDPSPNRHESEVTAASAFPQHRYMTLTITVYPFFWTLGDEDQERTIVHELAHAIADHTNTLVHRRVALKRVTAEEAVDANERLAETIANIAWKAYR